MYILTLKSLSEMAPFVYHVNMTSDKELVAA